MDYSIPIWLAYVPIPFLLACWLGATMIVAYASGWRGLSQRFRRRAPTAPSAGPVMWRFSSGSIGAPSFPTSFRRVLHLELSRDGIGLSLNLLFAIGAPPLFIPWSQIAWSQKRTIMRFWTIYTVQVRGSNVQISFRGDVGEALLAAATANSIPLQS